MEFKTALSCSLRLSMISTENFPVDSIPIVIEKLVSDSFLFIVYFELILLHHGLIARSGRLARLASCSNCLAGIRAYGFLHTDVKQYHGDFLATSQFA
jgi:hypothetical protein